MLTEAQKNCPYCHEKGAARHVKKDPDLHNVYHMMRYRRGYVAKNTAAKIWEMLDEGHSLATIASRLHISRDRVKYQRDKRRKMGLVK